MEVGFAWSRGWKELMTAHGKEVNARKIGIQCRRGHQAPECLPSLLLFSPALPNALLVEAWHAMESFSSFENERGMGAT